MYCAISPSSVREAQLKETLLKRKKPEPEPLPGLAAIQGGEDTEITKLIADGPRCGYLQFETGGREGTPGRLKELNAR